MQKASITVTKDRVERLQEKLKLKVDGVVGDETWGAFESELMALHGFTPGLLVGLGVGSLLWLIFI